MMMHLLFVDDDLRLLAALKQSLWWQRKVWEVRFADSAAAALETLEDYPCDLVVTDMRMPSLDGVDLLKRVRALYPSALRFELSGHMDDALAARCAPLAQRCLAKPIEAEVLIATLKRALELRQQFQSDAMRRWIGGLGTLPSLSTTCAALEYAIGNDGVSLGEVSHIVERDPAMTAKLLQLVNSAFFGAPRRVVNVEEAVRYLGLNAVHSLLLANALFEQLAGHDTARLEAEQTRSLLTARYARRFPLRPQQAEVAATAALLHNAGELALLARLPQEYQANKAFARLRSLQIEEAERLRMGVTHAQMGAYLLSLWGLPFDVVEAVGSQEAPPSSLTELDPTAVVWLAQGLAAERIRKCRNPEPHLADVGARLGVAHVVEAIRKEIAASVPQSRAS